MLINALHAALEDRERTLNRVRVDDAAHIFTGLVIDAAVAEIIVAELVVREAEALLAKSRKR
jgi:hypothetical protein